MLKRAGLILVVIVVLLIAVAFTVLNTGTVELDFGFARGPFPVSVAMAVAFGIGCLFGMLCMTAFVFRLVRERRSLRKSLRVSESEVSSLRNLPLSDAD